MELKKILCTVDFSDAEHPAVQCAKTLATLSGSSILLLHVMSSRDMYERLGLVPKEVDKHMAVYREATQKQMDEFIAKHFSGGNVSGILLEGKAAETIVRVAENQNIDLIVMGTHGRQGFNKLLFGSVANEVVRTAGCPVLTVRPEGKLF